VSLDAISAEVGRTRPRAADRPGSRCVRFTEEIADAIRTFREAGYTQLEMMKTPGTMASLEALAPVLESLDAD
jgi:hypothetical protein